MSHMDDESLLQEFVAESRDHLSSIEPDLLVMERDEKNTDSEIINRIFRAIHSIKGASGFFGLEALKNLSHSMENTFMLMRDGKLFPTAEIMDPLLIGVDRLREMLEDIQASEQVAYHDIVDALEACINGTSGNSVEAASAPEPPKEAVETDVPSVMQTNATESTSSSASEPVVSSAVVHHHIHRETVEHALRHGQTLYRIEVDPQDDLQKKGRTAQTLYELLASIGTVLDLGLPDSESLIANPTQIDAAMQSACSGGEPWALFYATVLEPDLMAPSLAVSAEQIQEVDFTELFPEAGQGSPMPVPPLQGGGENQPSSNESVSTNAVDTPAVSAQGNNINRDAVEHALRHGQSLYRIELDLEGDLQKKGRTPHAVYTLLASIGTVLDLGLANADALIADPEALAAALANLPVGPNGGQSWSVLYATVLEPDLMAPSLGLASEQIQEVDFVDLFPEEGVAKAVVSAPEVAQLTQSDSIQSDSIQKPVQNGVVKAAEPAAVTPPPPPKPSATDSSAQGKPAMSQAPPPEATKPSPPKNTGSSDSNETIRVKVDLLNRLMDLAGELVLARNQLTRIFESQSEQTHEMNSIIQNVDLVTSDLQEHIMQTRMQAISSVFGKFPRLVRDLSRQLKKEINLEMSGEEVELDKSILESLSDPLTHLIRNCCDHAMETPDVRESLGKPRQGTVYLKAFQESGHINIAVIDDGAGIDHERVARKALDSGVVTEQALRQMTPQEQVNLIFLPGFSTAEAVTDVSGRGVGMDVVRTNIEQIGGSISIETEKGKGTTIFLRLPLTLAIIPSLVVTAAEQTFAVPQINLVELVCVKASQIASRIEKVGTASVLRLRGKLLPLIKLSVVLGLQEEYVDPTSGQKFPEKRKRIEDARIADPEGVGEAPSETLLAERRRDHVNDYNILVLKAGERQYGLIVDEIRDIEEIVVKPLSCFIKNCKAFSGATIMGDGRVAMILDVSGIIAISNLAFSEISGEEQKRKLTTTKTTSTTQSQSILLFTNATQEIFAMPLSDILRLEKIQISAIEQIGDQKFLPYQGKSMSLIFLHEHLPITPLATELEEAYLVIPTEGNSMIGIVVASILDTLDFDQALEASAIRHAGIKGSAVINKHVTLFIDTQGLLDSSGLMSSAQRSLEWQATHLQLSS